MNTSDWREKWLATRLGSTTLACEQERCTTTVMIMTGTEAIVLGLLSSGRELLGLQIVDESNGAVSRMDVYVTLAELKRQGLISSRPEELPRRSSGFPRRLYTITDEGQRALLERPVEAE